MSTNYFSRINGSNLSTTGTGLDQLVDTISTDLGLSGRISDKDIISAMNAANAMNAIIVEAVEATGVAPDGVFSVQDVRDLNQYISTVYKDEWAELHGDDEDGEETGYHLVQNDGARERFRGDNLTNTVADGIYHLGFEIKDNQLLNEDGDANATLTQAAEWLTAFYTDHSTTNSGLDRMTDMVMADRGLSHKISDNDISAGADAANGMNAIITEAIETQGLANDNVINVADIRQINSYIRDNYQEQWLELHGDDENDEETGFHLVQNDGANTRMFAQNFVNTVADGIFHLGFEIRGDNILNEDGDQNASLTDLADWVNFFYVDQGTTNTGLDELIQTIKSDRGLSKNTNAGDINEGAAAANSLNQLLVEAIEATNAAQDNLIDIEDVKAINQYLRDNYKQEWKELHGDDEDGEETGFHLVQNDGSNVKYRGDNMVNTVIDGLYHLGFKIEGDNVLNEDGDQNANLGDLATWLNNFYLGEESTFGSQDGDNIRGLNTDDKIWARDGNDKVRAGDGNDIVYGGAGNDKVRAGDGNDIVYGGAGNDKLIGGNGNDQLDGGVGDDKLYAGEGDDILIGGDGNNYLRGGDGHDRLTAGNGRDKLVGGNGNDQLDSGAGDDKLYAGDGDDILISGDGNDYLRGDNGNDHLDGGTGSDYLRGGKGDDKLYSVNDNANDRLRGDSGADEYLFQASGEGVGSDRVDGFNRNDGDKLIIGGQNADYILTQVKGNLTHIELTADGKSMGSIDVYGNLTAADIQLDENAFDNITEANLLEIA